MTRRRIPHVGDLAGDLNAAEFGGRLEFATRAAHCHLPATATGTALPP
jgi:hypothetical protein